MSPNRSAKLPIVIPCPSCNGIAGHVAGSDFAFRCDSGHTFQRIPKLVPCGRRTFGYVLLPPDQAHLIPTRWSDGERVFGRVRGSEVEIGRLVP